VDQQPERKPGALILGGHFLSLGAARNLAQHGVPVYVADSEVCVTQFSRKIAGAFRCPAARHEQELVEFLLQLATQPDLRGSVLFPSTDEHVRVVAQYHQRLSAAYHLTTPPWQTTKYLYDKRLTRDLAIQQDVPIPATYNPASFEALAALDIEYPVVLKPAITVHLTSVTKKKAYRADSEPELRSVYQMMASFMNPSEILIQELIPGRAENLYSFFGLFREGEPVTGFAARRPRQHPMEFGRASTLAETVDQPELAVLATRFLKGIHYTGLAEVEFMYDQKHDRFELLEVNPRIWGWHTLAICAGVDLPYLAYAQALGDKVKPGTYRTGARWVHLTTDIPTVATELWHRRMSLRDYFQSMRGTQDAVFSWNDPLPFIMEWLLIPYFIRKRGF
jgi:D-aspartate ligase